MGVIPAEISCQWVLMRLRRLSLSAMILLKGGKLIR